MFKSQIFYHFPQSALYNNHGEYRYLQNISGFTNFKTDLKVVIFYMFIHFFFSFRISLFSPSGLGMMKTGEMY